MRFTSALLLLLFVFPFAHVSTAQTFTVAPPELVRSDGTTERQALFQQDETIGLQWSQQLESANLKIGASPGVYEVTSISVSGNQTQIVPNEEGLSTGKYYAVITNSEGDTFSEIQADADTSEGIEYSQEFRLIVEPSSAPTINDPRGSTESSTPTFEWEAISGVPAYWIVVSSTPFEITRNEETNEIEVQGANVVWQVITTETSIQYGTTNPEDAFPDIQPPPLESGNEYNYTVLNVFSEENLALASDVFGSVVSFSLSEEGSELPAPSLSAPEDSTTIYGDDTITLDWDPVDGANDYSAYVFELTVEGGSEVELPIWNTSTTNTLVDFPAETNLKRGTYLWYVVPSDGTGAGNQSETRLFNYEVPMGEFRFRTQSTRTGNDIVGATVTARSLGQGYTPRNPFIARGQATLTDSLVAGTYEFESTLTGFADTTVTVDVEAATRTSFDIDMRPLPAQILGSVVDEDDAVVSNAEVTVTNTSTGVSRSTTTNASGEFSIGLPPGTYDIQAGGSGLISSPVRTVSVSPDENRTLSPPLSVQNDEIPVSGSVVNQQGEGVQLADVTATSGDQTQEVSTDGSGTYSFVLSSGDWVLEANKSGFVGSDPRELSLSTGDNLQNENFTLTPQANQISGTVSEVVTLPGGDTDLAPFEGATVTATPLSGSPKTTTTLSNGQYSLDLGSGSYTIEASAENYESSQTFEATVDVGETLDGFDFELTPNSAEINGQVTLSDSTPVEDATVTIENIGSTQTLSNGAYTLSVPPGSYDVSVSKSGFIAPEDNSVSVGPDGVVNGINFTLTPNAGTISGTVTSEGEPVTGATVTATQNGETESVTTTDLGEYSLSVSPGTWSIVADKSGFAPSSGTSITVAAGQQSTNNNIELEERIAQIGGTVTDGSSPIRNATITITSLTDSTAPPIETQSMTEGEFSVSVESGEMYEVRASKSGFRSGADTTEVLSPEASVSLSLVLTPTSSSIAGTVQDENGSTLSGATVRAIQDGSTVDSTTTAVDGAYSLSLDNGTYTMEADLGGYTKSSRQTTLETGENLTAFDFNLSENFSILRGTIEDDSSAAVDQALVSVTGPTSASVRSSSDGSYIVTGLAAGSYEVDVQKTGFETKTINLSLEEGTTVTRNVTLPQRRGRVQGNISTTTGTELGGATVTAASPGGQTFSSVSASDGTYQITALPVGTYDVSASLAGYSSDTTATVTIAQDSSQATANISDFTVNEASLSGVVRDSTSNSPLLNVTVQLSGDAGTGSDATDTNGRYTIDELAPGTYTVTVQKDGFGGPTRQVQLGNGESDTLDLAMGPNIGEISGTVVGSDGDPLDFSATVRASSGNIDVTATTDAEGNFSIGGLENGRTYTVATRIFRKGYSNVSTSLTLPDGSTSTDPVELTVPKKTASIRGSAGTPEASLQLKNEETGSVARVTQSQSDSAYQFTFLPAATYTVVPSKAGYSFSPDSQTVSLSTDQTEVLDFQSTSSIGALTVSVTVDADRSNEGVQINAASSDNTVSRNLTTSQNGRVTFTGLPAGKTYLVQASLSGFTSAPSSHQVSLSPGDSTSVSFELTLNRSAVEGQVTDADGNPLNSVSVSARDQSDGSVSSTQTDNQGRYKITDLASGSYAVSASEPGFEPDTVEVNLDNGETRSNTNFALNAANVRIQGIARQAEEVAEGVTVKANGRSALSTTTDDQGRFVFPQAPIKIGASDTTTYVISVSGANFTTQRRVLDIPASRAGETIVVDDFLLPSGQIRLTVTDGVAPLPGVNVTLTRPGGQSSEKVTGAEGQILSDDRLQAGVYQASVAKGGYLNPTAASLEYSLPTDTSRLETTLALPYRHTPPDSVKADEATTFRIRFKPEVSTTDVSATLYYKKSSSQSFQSVSMTKRDTSFTGVLPAQFSLSPLNYYVEVVDDAANIRYTSSQRTLEPLAAGILTAARIVPSVNSSRLRVGDTYTLDIRLQDGLSESLEDEFVGEDAVGEVNWSLGTPSAGTIEFPDQQDSTRVALTFEETGQYRLDIQARLRGSLVSRSATVQVADVNLKSLSASSPTSRLSNESGGTQLSVSAVDTSGASVLLGDNLTWSVTPESAASVSASGFLSPTDSTFIGPVSVVARDAKSQMQSELNVRLFASIDGDSQVQLRGGNGSTFTIPEGAVTFPAQIGLSPGTQGPTKEQTRPLGSDQLYKVSDNIRKFTFRADRSLPGDSLMRDATLSFEPSRSLRLHDGERKIGRFDKTEAQWRTKSTQNQGGMLVANSVRKFGEYAVMSQNEPLDLREVAVLPNPFSPKVAPLKIGYFLDTTDPPAEVTIRIFNARGELVRTLLDNDLQPPGRYGSRTGVKKITWDGMTDGGLKARNGRYIVQIKARDQTGVVTERIPVVLIK